MMKRTDFVLKEDNDGNAYIVDAEQSMALQAIDYCAISHDSALRLYTEEEHREIWTEMEGTPLNVQRALAVFLSSFNAIWDPEHTTATIPELLRKFGSLEDKVSLLEIRGEKYLCAPEHVDSFLNSLLAGNEDREDTSF